MDNNPIIIRRWNGEYSTIERSNGVVETMWFGSNGAQILVSRHVPESKRDIALRHIATWESEHENY